MPPKVILIVDDEIAVLELVASILEGAGYQVRQTANPREALRIVQQEANPPQLLLTDLVMPKLSGLALAAQVHRLRPEVPVIFMSGFAQAYEDELTGSVCLRKPFTAGQLLSAVDDILTAPPKGSRGNPSLPTG